KRSCSRYRPPGLRIPMMNQTGRRHICRWRRPDVFPRCATRQRNAVINLNGEVARNSQVPVRRSLPAPFRTGTGRLAIGIRNMQTTAAITLHSYWTERRGRRPAPLRSEMEPAHLATILPDVFILEGD